MRGKHTQNKGECQSLIIIIIITEYYSTTSQRGKGNEKLAAMLNKINNIIKRTSYEGKF